MPWRRPLRRGFADNEFLIPIVFTAIEVALWVPALQAMRESRLSPAAGILLLAAIVGGVWGPWIYQEIEGRRRLRRIMRGDEERPDDG